MSLAGAVCLCLLAGGCLKTPAKPAVELEKATEDQKALFAMGRMIGTNIVRFHLSDEDLAFVTAGLAEAAQEKPLRAGVDMQNAGQHLAAMERERLSKGAAVEKEAGRAFLEKEAQQKDARPLPSGLVFRSLQEGKGVSPTAEDTVAVNYAGTLRDGTLFDASTNPRPGAPNGGPVNFKLNKVIPCWTEALQLMKPGGKAHISCPSTLAYGDAGGPPKIPGGAALAFDVELLAIAPPAPSAPQAHK